MDNGMTLEEVSKAMERIGAILRKQFGGFVEGGAMKIKHVKIHICEACLNGIGQECHTPGCALFLHAVDIPIMPELYEVIAEYDVNLEGAAE